MPRRDGTGPTGMGSLTGRGMGPCNSANDVSHVGTMLNARRVLAVGRRMGRGLGLGRGRGFRRSIP